MNVVEWSWCRALQSNGNRTAVESQSNRTRLIGVTTALAVFYCQTTILRVHSRYRSRVMGSKYQEFTDDVTHFGNETNDDDDDQRGHVPVDAMTVPQPAATSSSSTVDVRPPVTTVSPGTQPVIIVQAPKLQRSFERYPSKTAVIFGVIQVIQLYTSSQLNLALWQSSQITYLL